MNPAAGDLFPGSLGWSWAGAIWAWVLALSLGCSILRFSRTGQSHQDSAVSRLLACAVVGIAVEANVWLLLSAFSVLTPVHVLVVAAVLTAVSSVLAGRRLWSLLLELRGVRSHTEGPVWLRRTALACLAVLLLIVVRLAVLPSVHYDDLVYHLGLPRQALLVGHWPSLPAYYPSFVPSNWEATYVLPLSLGGGSGPQLMNAIALALLAVAGYRLARLGSGPGPALAVTALLLACPLFLGAGSLAGNDLFAGLALVVAVERLCATEGRQPVQIGLLAGAAWATKFSALPGVFAVGVAAAIVFPGTWARRLSRAGIISGTALLVGIGWTARAFYLTGNPLYPAFYGALGGQHWSARAASLVVRDSSVGAYPDRGFLALVAAPWDVIRTGGHIGTPGGINLIFVGLAVLGLLLAPRIKHVRVLLIFLATTYVGWVATSLMVRFAIAPLAALLPFAAALVQRTWDVASVRSRLTEPVAVFLLLAAVMTPTVAGINRELDRFGADTPFWGGTPRSDLLPSRINLAAAGRSMAADLPRDARVLLIGDGRLALMPRATVLSTACDEPAINGYLAGVTTAAELEERLARDFTHVVVNSRELERWAAEYGFMDRLPENGRVLLAACFGPDRPVWARWGDVAVYELSGRR